MSNKEKRSRAYDAVIQLLEQFNRGDVAEGYFHREKDIFDEIFDIVDNLLNYTETLKDLNNKIDDSDDEDDSEDEDDEDKDKDKDSDEDSDIDEDEDEVSD
jgi:hypothetical protein